MAVQSPDGGKNDQRWLCPPYPIKRKVVYRAAVRASWRFEPEDRRAARCGDLRYSVTLLFEHRLQSRHEMRGVAVTPDHRDRAVGWQAFRRKRPVILLAAQETGAFAIRADAIIAIGKDFLGIRREPARKAAGHDGRERQANTGDDACCCESKNPFWRPETAAFAGRRLDKAVGQVSQQRWIPQQRWLFER